MQDATKSLAATALAHFVNDGSLFALPLLYPVLVISFGLSQTHVAALAGLTSVFAVIAAPFIGKKSDSSQKYGHLMTVGVVLIAIGLFGYAFSVLSFRGILLFLFLLPFTLLIGIGSSFYHPLGAAILNEKWESSARAKAMGINGSIGSLGVTVYPIITVALVVSFAIPAVSLLAAFGILAAFVIFMLMRNFKFSARRNYVTDATNPAESKHKTISVKTLLPYILVLTIVAFLRGLSQGIVQFLPIFIHTVKGVNYSYLGLAFAIMPAMGIFSQPLFGSLSDRYGRRFALGISGVGVTASMFLFLSTQQVFLSEIFLAAFGLFNFTSFPLIMGLATEISPEGSTTIGSSIVWGIGTSGGAAVGPVMVALIALPGALGSLSSSFYVVILISFLSVVLLPFVPKPTRNQ